MSLRPKREQATKLPDRLRIVIDAKVAQAVYAFARPSRRTDLLNNERSRLLPSAITTRGPTRFERVHQPFREGAARREERVAHRD